MKRTTLALLVLLCSSASAQFTEVLEVRVTNVDVIVTKGGQPVSGLTRDDFEIYENGVKKEISNFLEIQEASPSATLTTTGTPAETTTPAVVPPPSPRPRSITIFVDNTILSPARRNQVLPHLKKFLAEQVRPGDLVAVVVWGAGMKVMLDPTSDATRIAQAVEQLGKWAVVNSDLRGDREQFYESVESLIHLWSSKKVALPNGEIVQAKPKWSEGLSLARAYADKVLFDARARGEALKSVIATQRAMPGRKIFVLLTQNMSTNPAEEAFLYLDSRRDEFDQVTAPAVVMAREFELPSLVTEIARTANSAGVAIYPIDGGGKDSNTPFAPDASEGRSLATRGQFAVADTSTGTLMGIAADTGGVASVGSTNFALAFDTIANDLNTYYSLGYRSEGERTDRLNRIEVKLKKRGYQVRTRNSVVEQSVASEMQDAVTANLFAPSATNELGVRVAAGAATPRDAESVTIPLTLTIPTDRLALLPDGTDVVGKFAVHAAFLRGDGAVSKVARQEYPLRFTAESLPRRKEITVKIDVAADPKVGAISVGVMDQTTRATGFASVSLTPPSSAP
ncbi:MAG TPA: VWA domain-containing protein [Thermoanaerobaculia bacterium]|nr:VWA domain-containing protein [Thermoanaerobaculia bacterium]